MCAFFVCLVVVLFALVFFVGVGFFCLFWFGFGFFEGEAGGFSCT